MSYQNTILVGNVGGEVTTRFTQNGKQVANFNIAVNEKFGEETQTTWFRVVAWEKLAEIAADHIVKGQMLLVEGRIAAEKWTDQQGSTQVALRITANKLRLLGGKPEVTEE